ECHHATRLVAVAGQDVEHPLLETCLKLCELRGNLERGNVVDSRHLLGLHNTGENGGETEGGDEISRPMLSGVPLLFCQRFSHMGRGGNAPVRRLVTFKEALHLLIGQLPECEPTTHRLLPKGARPPPYYRSQCLREPTAAAWLGVGYSFNSLYG